jgi:hypothetical protein
VTRGDSVPRAKTIGSSSCWLMSAKLTASAKVANLKRLSSDCRPLSGTSATVTPSEFTKVLCDRIPEGPNAEAVSVAGSHPAALGRVLQEEIAHAERKVIMAIVDASSCGGGNDTWIFIGNTLSDQNISVWADTDCLAGDDVNGACRRPLDLGRCVRRHRNGVRAGIVLTLICFAIRTPLVEATAPHDLDRASPTGS